LPESLLLSLERLGHQADSINSLHLKGIDNGTLYRIVAQDYDLCFTKDFGFTHNVRQIGGPSKVKVLHVVIPQRPAGRFLDAFIRAFLDSDWSRYTNGSDWP
jgi:hypothetical protein